MVAALAALLFVVIPDSGEPPEPPLSAETPAEVRRALTRHDFGETLRNGGVPRKDVRCVLGEFDALSDSEFDAFYNASASEGRQRLVQWARACRSPRLLAAMLSDPPE